MNARRGPERVSPLIRYHFLATPPTYCVWLEIDGQLVCVAHLVRHLATLRLNLIAKRTTEYVVAVLRSSAD